MSRNILLSVSVRYVIPLVLVLGLVFGWAAVAIAQTSAGGQYGNPTGTPSGNPKASGNPTSKATSGGGGAAQGSGGGAAKGGDPGVKVLPATGGGGPLILVVGGALALGSAGLLALRRGVR